MTYTLGDVEQRLARFLAKSREDANRGAGVANSRIGPQSDQETDLTGIGAELAFCRLFNVYPDLTIGPRAGGHDCFWAGRALDVKGTPRANGRLLAVPWKVAEDVEVYALMTGDFPTYTYRGMATAATLLASETLTDLGHGPTHALDQAALELRDFFKI